MRAWNLLHHPALAQRRRLRHRLKTGAAGLLLGVALSWVGAQVLARELARMQTEQSDLQRRWAEVQERTQAWRAQERLQQTWERQLQPLREVQMAQKTWAAWHHALQQEAVHGSWQLLRLQQEPGRLELQGLSANVHTLGQARDRLVAQWPQNFAASDVATVDASVAAIGTGSAAVATVPDLKLHSVTLARADPLPSGQAEGGDGPVEFVLQAPWPLATSPASSPAAGQAASPAVSIDATRPARSAGQPP